MIQRLQQRLRGEEKGFTLIELLIVIVILAILASVVVLAVSGITDRGGESACKSDVKNVEVANESYFAKEGSYAASVAVLVSEGFLKSNPTTAGHSTEYTIAYTVDNAATPKTYTVTGTLTGGGTC